MIEPIPATWEAALTPALGGADGRRLRDWLSRVEGAGTTVYPPPGQRLRAFELTPLDSVKVVILGQDPYHGAGQAHGLAFSVPDGVRLPPSLANIYRELRADLGIDPPASGNLERWARQGVLLLNTALTVEDGRAGSHAGRGWEAITDAAVAAVAARDAPSVFVLWGKHARDTALKVPQLHHNGENLVLTAPHPSPLSAHRGFFGSKPFSQANAFLTAAARGAIAW